MNLRDFKYLIAVADLKNFSQAAEQCHISQPTLSSQIKKLEDDLGIQIFERSNKKVLVTEAGRLVIESAKRILKEVDRLKDIAEYAGDPLSGKFKLGAFPTLATYFFPQIVPFIQNQMPKLKLVLVEEKTDTLIDHLKKGEIDAAFLALPIFDESLQSQALFHDDFLLAVPGKHPLAKHDGVTFDDLLPYTVLLLEEGHCLRDQALELCQMVGIKEESDFRATGLETLKQMVKVGIGITFVPQIARSFNEDGITYVPFSKPAPTRTIGLVWRKTTSRLEVIQKLLEFKLL